jgi:hypothetical protein
MSAMMLPDFKAGGGGISSGNTTGCGFARPDDGVRLRTQIARIAPHPEMLRISDLPTRGR